MPPGSGALLGSPLQYEQLRWHPSPAFVVEYPAHISLCTAFPGTPEDGWCLFSKFHQPGPTAISLPHSGPQPGAFSPARSGSGMRCGLCLRGPGASGCSLLPLLSLPSEEFCPVICSQLSNLMPKALLPWTGSGQREGGAMMGNSHPSKFS